MKLERDTIIEATHGRLSRGRQANRQATSLTWDSRQVVPGALFAALPGEHVDGHDFIAAAARQNAAGAITQREPNSSLCDLLDETGTWLVVVDDVQEALGALAAYWRTQLSARVVAITGSSGKTTTKNLVRDCLQAHGSVVATLANQNNELGVPATLLSADEDTDFIVVEMGMRGLGQVASLCRIAQPNIALVTNVGTSHVELLGSQDAIARAKAEVFAGLGDDGIAVLNNCEEWLDVLIEYGKVADRGLEVVFYDGSGTCTGEREDGPFPGLFASNVEFDEQGRPSFDICCTLDGAVGSAHCSLQLCGAHNVHNAMAAAAVGRMCGMGLAQIAQALQASVPEQGRLSAVVAKNGLRVIDDSYNANPDSMRASLASFDQMKVEGRRIAVLGDMGELGDYSDEGHSLVGSLVAQSSVERLLCVGLRARVIAQAAVEAGMDQSSVSCVGDAQAAIEALADIDPALSDGDCVLVKASHSMSLETVVHRLVQLGGGERPC